MRIRKLRFATALALVALLAGAGACSLDAPDGQVAIEDQAVTTAVSITLVPVHPRLDATMAAASALASESASRSFMFMDRATIKIVNLGTNKTVMDESVVVSGGMAGGQATVSATLVVGRTYQVSVSAYNDKLSATSASFSGTGQITPSMYMDNNVYINLLPVSTVNLTYGGAGYSTPTAVVPAIYDPNYDNGPGYPPGRFIQNGSELWLKFVATGETVSIYANPTSYYLYGGLYAEDGRFLAGGLSPSFGMGTGAASVYLDSGVTTGSTYYVGLAPVSVGTATDPAISGTILDVALTAYGITDDTAEPDDSFATAQALFVNVNSAYADAFAADADWYEIYLGNAGDLTVTATSNAGYSNGIFGFLGLYGSSGQSITYDELKSDGSGSSMGKTEFILTASILEPGYYYILADFQGAAPLYGYPTVGGSYTLTANLFQQTREFTPPPPSVGTVTKGKLLANPGAPGLLVYLYLDTYMDFYWVRSTDGGSTWSNPYWISYINYPIRDFAAEMDSYGTALYLAIETYDTSWDSVTGKLAAGDSSWSSSTVWGTNAYGGSPGLMAYPSSTRLSSGDVIFGYGYDSGLNTDDGASAHSVTWNSFYQYFSGYNYVPVNYQADNPWSNQIFADRVSGDTYYLYPDNHWDWDSNDLFMIRGSGTPVSWSDYTEYLLVDTPTTVSQPFLGRLGNDLLALVYLDTSTENSILMYRTASGYSSMQNSTSYNLASGVRSASVWEADSPNPFGLARTLFTAVTSDGAMHVVYQDATSLEIWRTTINPFDSAASAESPINDVGIASGGKVDGVQASVEAGVPVLYISWHDTLGAQVTRIPNP